MRIRAALADRYTIERELGQGGMATVYLAHDVRHDRKVAIKVLRPKLAAVLGADRFVQEIKTTANLQHPHILPLFDSGDADGFLYYVMPYIEGETLRDKLNREKQLSIDEAIRITTEVADALDYAHRQNVIHRDIKPENILLHDGRPMVADFGIALAVSAAAGGRMTETGLSLGTPHYMSPEQATAEKELTNRSDIYSLGAMLYEMLTGSPPHVGSSAQQIIMKIVTEEAQPVTDARKSVPPNVAAAVARALEKLPADRFETAQTFVAALRDRTFVHGRVSTGPSVHSFRRQRGAWVAVIVLAAALAWSLIAGDTTTPESDRTVRHLHISLPDTSPLVYIGEATAGIGLTSLALSPDGMLLAYVGPADSTTRLYVRPLNGDEVLPLYGTEGAFAPFFSPDGAWIGFFVGQRLFRVASDGSQILPVAETNWSYGGTWSHDGRIAVVTQDTRALEIVSPSGARLASFPLTSGLRTPYWMPGTEWILGACGAPTHVCVVSAQTGELRHLTVNGEPASAVDSHVLLAGTNPRFVRPAYLIYAGTSDNVVLAARLDPRTLRFEGEPQVVLSGVRLENQGAFQLAASDDDMVFAPGARAVESRLVWVGANGIVDTLPFPARVYGSFHLSPDGRRVAIQAAPETAERELWFFDLQREVEQRWVDDGRGTGGSIWPGPWIHGTNQLLISVRRPSGSNEMFLADAVRGSGGETLWTGSVFLHAWSITRDSMVLLHTESEHEGTYQSLMNLADVRSLPDEPGLRLAPLVQGVGDQTLASLSPDGEWYTYTTNESGPYEVWALRVSARQPPLKISSGGGELPKWSPRGDGFYYRNGRRWYWVQRKPSGADAFEKPVRFIDGDFLNIGGPEHEVAPDGRRLMLLQGSGEQVQVKLHVVTNWPAELDRLIGGGSR